MSPSLHSGNWRYPGIAENLHTLIRYGVFRRGVTLEGKVFCGSLIY
jgi:hypothetical protein